MALNQKILEYRIESNCDRFCLIAADERHDQESKDTNTHTPMTKSLRIKIWLDLTGQMEAYH